MTSPGPPPYANAPPGSASGQETSVLVWFVNALRRRLHALIAGALTGLLLAGVALHLSPPRWQAFADIELTPSRALNDIARIDAGATLSDQSAENQGVMLLSRPVLLRTLANLPAPAHLSGSDPALALRDSLSVRRLPRTMVWRITALGDTPDAAARIANALANAWVAEHRQLRVDAAEQLTARLAALVPLLEQQLRTSEQAAARWRREHALVTGGDADGASLTEKQLADMNARLADARAAAIKARARLDSFSVDNPRQDDSATTPAIQILRRQMNDLARRDAELATRYGPQYPERAAMRAQIGAMVREIGAEKERALKALQAEVDIAASQEAAIRRSLDSTQTESAPQGAASDQAIRLRELERQAAADRQAYETALANLRRLRELSHTAGPEARVMSPAAATGLQTLSPALLLLATAATGAAAFLGLALMHERLVDPCLCPDQLAMDLGVARVAETPALGHSARKARGHIMQPATIVAVRPHSRFAEAFRTVRITLDAANASEGLPTPDTRRLPGPQRGRIVLVTSGQPGDGKTTTAIGLALSLAGAGHRVALVDADLRNAGLSRFFELRTHAGLADILRDQTPYLEASVRRANLAIVPAGSLAGAIQPPLSLLDTETLPLLRRMAMAFDHVILDGPPLDVTEDAAVLMRAADTAVLAVRWGRTPRHVARRMADRLAGHGKLGAVMLTRVNTARAPRFGGSGITAQASRIYFNG